MSERDFPVKGRRAGTYGNAGHMKKVIYIKEIIVRRGSTIIQRFQQVNNRRPLCYVCYYMG